MPPPLRRPGRTAQGHARAVGGSGNAGRTLRDADDGSAATPTDGSAASVLAPTAAPVVLVNDSAQQDNSNSNSSNSNSANQRPSTLSVVFGFTLTGIATASLFVVACILHRKRRKKLAKRRQRKQSVPYRATKQPTAKPSSASSSSNVPAAKAVALISPRRSVAPALHSNNPTDAADEDDTTSSSYHGINDSDEPSEDVFAKELQVAATLDQQAWNQLRTQQETGGNTTPDRQFVSDSTRVKTNHNNHSNHTANNNNNHNNNNHNDNFEAARSFPYGDEPGDLDPATAASVFPTDAMPDYDDPSEEGIEWTEEDLAGTVNPSILSIGTPSTTTTNRDDNDSSPSNNTDVVMEVERLTSFVKRYEERKERRVQREQQSRTRTFARIGFDGQVTNSTVHVDEKKEVDAYIPDAYNVHNVHDVHNVRPTLQRPVPTARNRTASISQTQHPSQPQTQIHPQQSQQQQQQQQLQLRTPHLPSQLAPGASVDGRIRLENLELDLDDDETTLEDPDVRLGITPFSVQKPGTISYQNAAAPSSPMMQKLARDASRKIMQQLDEQTRESRLSHASKSSQVTARTQNTTSERLERQNRNRTTLAKLRGTDSVSQGSNSDGSKLQSLRATTSVVDTTRSEVNVRRFSSGSRGDSVANAKNRFRQSRSRSGSFSDLRSKFENAASKGAIFPPDVNWQYGSSTASAAGGPGNVHTQYIE